MATLSTDICNCFAVRQAARVVTQIYERHISQAGITASQFTILAVICSQPDLGMVELAQALVMDRTSLVRALKPLVDEQYIEKRSAGTGMRSKVSFALTEKGKDTFAIAGRYWNDAQKEWEERIGAERARALRDELIHVART